MSSIGHNNPPSALEEQEPKVTEVIDDASATLTGLLVETEAQDKDVGDIIKRLKGVKKAVNDAHKSDKEPWLEGSRRVDAQKNKLIEQIDRALKVAQETRTPYLQKLEQERLEKERKAREKAEAKQRELQEAHKAKEGLDLEEAERIASLEEETKQAKKDAARAARPVATGLRTVWTTEIADLEAALNHYFADPRLSEAVLAMAKSDVHSGKREIPGFNIQSERRAA